MIFLKKKPNGYVYTDLFKKNCFENLRDLEKVNHIEIKKHSTSKEKMYYVSESYMEYADSIIVSLPYAHVVEEITDDRLSEIIYKIAKEVVNTKSPYKTYRIKNTKEYFNDVSGKIYPKYRGYLMNQEQFNALMMAIVDAENQE